MPSGKWWPWVVAWILAAATVAVLASAVVRIGVAEQSLPPAEIRDWVVAVFGLGASVLAAFRWAGKKAHHPPARLAGERNGTAKRLLAVAVEEQWTNEARFRDWEKLPLIQIRWRAPADPRVPSHAGVVKNPPERASSAEIAELAAKFRACAPRRLVILGGPGTGKTTLSVRLLLELLATREGGVDEPVPVGLSVAQWDTDRYPRLQAWLAEQLYQDYPGLRWLGVDGVRLMVDLGHVLPILDGLDELPEPAQGAVIERLNDSLGARDQLVLTSRTAEYTHAAEGSGSGRGLNAAAVLEAMPVTPLAAADYLAGSLQSHQVDQTAWVKTLEVLRTEPGSALADVAATPLGLWLLRTVYITGDGDPDELTDPVRFSTPGALRAHLFDHLIAAFLPPGGDRDGDKGKPLGLSRTYQAGDVKRWLAFLARHLTSQPARHDASHPGTRDFAWWRLAATTGRTPSPGKTGLAVGCIAALVAGPMVGLVAGLKLGLVAGLAVGIATGIATGTGTRRLAGDRPGYASLRSPRGPDDVRSKLTAGLTAGLSAGPKFGLTAGLATWTALGLAPGFVDALDQARDHGLDHTVTGALAVGLRWGLPYGVAFSLGFGLAAGLAAGLIGWVETPSPAAQATTPQASLHADRMLNLTRIVCGCLVFGLVGVSAVGLALIFSVDMNIWHMLKGGLIFGPALELVGGLVCGLGTGRHRAWLAYKWATWRLSRDGVLPRNLMPFLDDMHRLGLLRTVGRIYQFRHAELHDHLAETYNRLN